MKTITLSILQFNTFVKNILDAEEFLYNVGVFGEITNFKVSGNNAYFDLKDENAMLSCVKFGANDLMLKNGDKVTVFGRVNFYVKSGRLNFIVSKVEGCGLGDLYQKFLLLKNRLESEGYFREEIKKDIPRFTKRIGVVTSETGAVIRDIINVTRKKNPFTDIVLYPSKVQGLNAEIELANGIKYFNSRTDIDVIIVARGGGSLEDLSPFNTETIVKAIYESKLPVISAVGHETDFTLCDFASDLRVPTPSVAAEVAVFDYEKEVDKIKEFTELFRRMLIDNLNQNKEKLRVLNELIAKTMKLRLSNEKQRVIQIIRDIELAVSLRFEQLKLNFHKTIDLISKLNPIEILKSGYALIKKNDKKIVSVDEVDVGDELNVLIANGSLKVKVQNKEANK